MHSAIRLPDASVCCGRFIDAGNCDANTPTPHDPVWASTWSMVWHAFVPGAQIVMLTNGMFGTLLTPESTVTRATFAASTCGAAELLFTVMPDDPLVELELTAGLGLLEPPPEPPPPPPHAPTNTASRAAPSSVMNEDM